MHHLKTPQYYGTFTLSMSQTVTLLFDESPIPSPCPLLVYSIDVRLKNNQWWVLLILERNWNIFLKRYFIKLLFPKMFHGGFKLIH